MRTNILTYLHFYNNLKNNIVKYGLATTLILGGVAYSNSAHSQTNDDYKKEWPVMDLYSRPNITDHVYADANGDKKVDEKDLQAMYTGVQNDIDGDNDTDSKDIEILDKYLNGEINHLPGDWNKLSPSEKESWMNKRIPLYLEYISNNVDCDINSNIYFFNFTGVENFENYEGWDEDNNGIKEGYNYYKNKIKFENGFENIPLYEASVKTQEGTPHKIYCYLKGKDGEEIDPLNPKHWDLRDYLTGNKIEYDGDFLDKDSHVNISGMKVWNQATQQHELVSLIPFNLDNSVATVDTFSVNGNIMFQNPHTAIVDLSEKQDVAIEADGSEQDFSESSIGKPNLETNLKAHYVGWNYLYPEQEGPSVDYTPKVTYEDSEFQPFDSRYPEYGEFIRKYVAGSIMGRWNPTNEPALGDTTKFKVRVDDTIAPEITISSNVVEGEKGSNPEKLAKSLINHTYDASMSYGYPLDTVVTETQNPSFEDNEFYYYDTKISVADVMGNSSIEKQAEVKIKKNGTGIEELAQEGKNIDIKVLGNKKFRVTSIDFMKEGKIYVYNLLGQPLDIIEVNNLMPSEERELEYSGFDLAKAGTYFVNFQGNNSKATRTIEIQ